LANTGPAGRAIYSLQASALMSIQARIAAQAKMPAAITGRPQQG